ncbi:hypothetical protein Bhyg_01156 [Pseudolycoriella hygida]|uniref:Uncharacterized protein n=1 Tax=Pseudolycoriella hygida TaxID=35572 RepID=A0A9Q0N8W7_9DIPT|nr:hypothetical protein Bhyg_01156 [Pseudolycoriella hygida]
MQPEDNLPATCFYAHLYREYETSKSEQPLGIGLIAVYVHMTTIVAMRQLISYVLCDNGAQEVTN